MSSLTDWRVTIRDAIAAKGHTVHTTAPERPSPPLIFVGPSDPYLSREEGRAFGEEVLRLEVIPVAGKGVNDVKAEELDRMIDDCLAALDGIEGLVVRRVDRPGQISLANQAYLACAVNVECEVYR